VADSDADVSFASGETPAEDPTYSTIPSVSLGSSEVGERYLDPYNGSEMVYFALGSDQVTTAGQRRLADVAEVFKANPGMQIEITGHTCAIGDEKTNLRLSMQRAAAVSKFLIGLGVDASQIMTRGMGELFSEGSDESYRRAEVRYAR
jgi:outer membrane protein OmpA-like peptidoglycan-associated protein